eukprot:scaffold926_cov408-Prasinococcus_capsulatus_cf.AAC.24
MPTPKLGASEAVIRTLRVAWLRPLGWAQNLRLPQACKAARPYARVPALDSCPELPAERHVTALPK